MNPITWSLTLLHHAAISAFGAGYFDDAGDVPGTTVLMYTLRGEWQPAEPSAAGGAGGGSVDGGTVRLEKQYTAPELFGIGPIVRYDGRLVRRGAPAAAAVALSARLAERVRVDASTLVRAGAAGGRRVDADGHVAQRGGGHARLLRGAERGGHGDLSSSDIWRSEPAAGWTGNTRAQDSARVIHTPMPAVLRVTRARRSRGCSAED